MSLLLAIAYVMHILGDVSLQQTSYALVCACCVVWLVNQFRYIISMACSLLGYAMAIAVCYLSYVVLQYVVIHGDSLDSAKRFGDLIMTSIVKGWSARNGTEESM